MLSLFNLPPILSYLSLKKEKNPFPPSPFSFKDLLLWSPPVFSFSRCISFCLSSSLCWTCWLITNRISSCNKMKRSSRSLCCVAKRYHLEFYILLHRPTCHASSSWDSATLCLMVLRSCWVSDSFSWRTVSNSLSKELDIYMMISKT